jgi:hypothetical protein
MLRALAFIAAIMILGALITPRSLHAQEPDAQATIAALETQVAALQTQVAGLMPASATSTPAATSAEDEIFAFVLGESLPQLPAGDPGVVDVITVGAPVRSSVPVVVRNNTNSAVALDDVFGVARDQEGTLVLSGEVSNMTPYRLPPGQIAAGSVYFGQDVPPEATLEFEPQVEPFEEREFGSQDLIIIEAEVTPDGIVGIAANPTPEELSGPFSVTGVCFDSSGEVRGYYSAFAAKDELEIDESTPFSATFYGEGPCDVHIIGLSGFKGF